MIEDEEQFNVKKTATISHFGKLSLEESRKLLEMFNGDVVEAVEYAMELRKKENPVQINEEKFSEMLERMKPFVEAIQSKYTNDEIGNMTKKLKEQNDRNRGKFIEGLIYSYMGKLD